MKNKIRKRPIITQEQSGTCIPFPIPGEYLIARPDLSTGKLFLVKCIATKNAKKGKIKKSTRIDALKILCRFEVNASKPDATNDFALGVENIVMNLGMSPPEGKTILGVKIDIFYGDIENSIAPVYKYVYFDDAQEQELLECLTKVLEIWKTHKLPNLNVQIDIRKPAGRWEGSYRITKGDIPDVITLRPKDRLGKEEMLRLLLHEFAHGVDAHYVPTMMRVRWIIKYHEQVQVMQAEKAKLQDVMERFLQSGPRFTPEEESLEIYNQSLKYIREKHSLSRRDLFDAWETEEGRTLIESIWPQQEHLSSKTPLLTEYALENPAEFFAEAFSIYMVREVMGVGMNLPKDIQKLMNKTLNTSRASQ